MANIKFFGNTKIQSKVIFDLSGSSESAPTYAIGRSLSAVNEGSSVTFTLSTTNVANGTVFPYTISGISSTDVTTGSLTGLFTVSNNLATAIITLSADQLTEGAETATITLNNAAASNFVVVNDTSVDASAYIAAVEAADGQALEASIRTAYNDFIVGCKADGIWDAIKASCILAGARTLNGALVPLVGTAPTNFNFVSDDYIRKTGLRGNGTTKYLNSNRSNNSDPQNNTHLSVNVTLAPTAGVRVSMGSYRTTPAVSSGFTSNGTSFFPRINNSTTALTNQTRGNSIGLFGVTRSSSSNYQYKSGTGSITTLNVTSAEPSNLDTFIFAGNLDSTLLTPSNARISFYSIGENLNLANLDTRVSALMTAINAAI